MFVAASGREQTVSAKAYSDDIASCFEYDATKTSTTFIDSMDEIR
jgi:hypothetical protein